MTAIRERIWTMAATAAMLAACAASAGAQAAGAGGMEVLGVRAQGMAGAFVAVADDATAVYWNPAGLATGDLFSMGLERSHVSLPSTGGDSPTLRTGAVLIGTPPLGVGYYRLGSTHVVPVTVVQSFGDHLNVGGAVKGVWGEGIDGRTHARLDVDLGVIVRTEGWRIGLVLRNLTEPSFGPEVIAFGGNRYRLERHARLGAAFFPREGLTLAVDADLMPLDQPSGLALGEGRRRALAIGAEQKVMPRLVVRGGVRAQTIDGARPSASGGASVEVRTSIWLDAQATGGGDRADRTWSVGLRFRY
ncbi:MAG: conjugal transfer protein TraF [Vicinamibacteraceae bacterium]